MHLHPPKALLFDLGGVVVDIDFARAIRFWEKYSKLDHEALRSRFEFDREYEDHEIGRITANQYFLHIAERLELSATADHVEEGWNSIFVGQIEPTLDLIASVSGKLPCYAFTNTNASHMRTWSEMFPRVVRSFDQIFASHKIGLRKPEVSAFNHICKATGVPAEGFLFFDDLQENVDAARNAGLQAVLVKSPIDVADALGVTNLTNQRSEA
jgi:FMN phosphatase YigB (HAD superfamily)